MTQYSTSLAYWQEIVKAALLGSERQAVLPPPPDSHLGALISQLDLADRERALLGAAAAMSLYRGAGRLPATDTQALPEPCELDKSPCCNARAATHLALMLKGQFKELLPEWLRAVAAVGKRVPDEHLPALLEMGRGGRDSWREIILPVIGRRGMWLAAQNSDWSYAVGQTDENVWETGGRDERIAYLRRTRDADPAQARAMLASTWNEEAPKDRAELIATLAQGLSKADEPFLETALDDGRKEVRRAAAVLLARLPDSQLRQRMMERLRQHLSFKRGWLGKHSLEVTPPEACDADMTRDSVQPKPPPANLGEKAWWLCEMISIVPPSIWRDEWNQAPDEIINAAMKSDWKEALLVGLVNATHAHADWDWAEAVVRWWSAQADQGYARLFSAAPFHIIPLMPAERFEPLALEALAADPQPIYDEHAALMMLRTSLAGWSASLARAVMDSIRRRIKAGISPKQTCYGVRPMLKTFALRIPPSLYTELATNWPTEAKDWEWWTGAVDEFCVILQFRHEMLKEINQ